MAEYGATKEEAVNVMEKSAQRAEEAGTRAAGAVRSVAEKARGFNVNEYMDMMMDTVDSVKAEVDRKVDDVKSDIRDHPFESVAIAAGVGILVGAFVALAGRRAAKRATRM